MLKAVADESNERRYTVNKLKNAMHAKNSTVGGLLIYSLFCEGSIRSCTQHFSYLQKGGPAEK